MKKIASIIALTIVAYTLTACSNKTNIDGEYYKIGEYGTDLVLTIKGDKGTVDAEGSTSSMIFDTNTQTFEISGFVNQTVRYTCQDNVITANITGTETQYFKKGSKSYKEELSKYGAD